jgi:hypothetical protein
LTYTFIVLIVKLEDDWLQRYFKLLPKLCMSAF